MTDCPATPDRLTDERLDELMRLFADVKPEPLRVLYHKQTGQYLVVDATWRDWSPPGDAVMRSRAFSARGRLNAELFVAAHNAFPALIAEVRALRQERSRLRADAGRDLLERLRALERVAEAAYRATRTMDESGCKTATTYGEYAAQAWRDLRAALAALEQAGGGEASADA